MKLIDIIFCDDIRNEVNNKTSLMGLYNDRIIIHTQPDKAISWPVPMRLAVYLRFALGDKDLHPEQFIFEYFLNNKNTIKIEGTINKIEKDQLQFNLMLIADGVPIESGMLGASIKILKEKRVLFSEENMQLLKILVK